MRGEVGTAACCKQSSRADMRERDHFKQEQRAALLLLALFLSLCLSFSRSIIFWTGMYRCLG